MALLVLISILAIAVGTQAFAAACRDITILDGNATLVAKTMGYDAQQALNQLDVTVTPHDYVNLSLDTPLSPDGTNLLEIRRAVPMTLAVDGAENEIMTWRSTVKDVLKDEGIVLGSLDQMVGGTELSSVMPGMALRIIRVRMEALSEYEDIPYDVLEQPNKMLNEGETQVVQAGVDGQLESVFRIVYEDGKPISRTFVQERILSEPINRIIDFGTVKNFTSHRGDLVRYSKTLDLKATAYTASFADTGKSPGDYGFGITRTGIRAREGVIAVDPRVIPLGTKVYVEVPGSAPDYGFAIAADIGSAIKGKLIDLYFDTTQQAKNWGRRSVRVYILNEQNDARWKQNENPCAK